MTSWEYRVVSKVYSNAHLDAKTYSIHEVYRDEQGKIVGYTDSVEPAGDTLEDLRQDLELMFRATNKPVISHEELNSNNET